MRLSLFILLAVYCSKAVTQIFFTHPICCCSCGTPQPPPCGCDTLQQTSFVDQSASLANCPICESCQLAQCPPPPTSICLPAMSIHLPSCTGCFGNGEECPVECLGYAVSPTLINRSELQSANEVSKSSDTLLSFPISGNARIISMTESLSRDPSLNSHKTESDAKIVISGLDNSSSIDVMSSIGANILKKIRRYRSFGEDKCPSALLKSLILDNIVEADPQATKEAIQEAAARRFMGDSLDIVCSEYGFTYAVRAAEHCEAQDKEVVCFVYKR